MVQLLAVQGVPDEVVALCGCFGTEGLICLIAWLVEQEEEGHQPRLAQVDQQEDDGEHGGGGGAAAAAAADGGGGGGGAAAADDDRCGPPDVALGL